MTGKFLPQVTGAWPSLSGLAVLKLALGQVFLAGQKESSILSTGLKGGRERWPDLQGEVGTVSQVEVTSQASENMPEHELIHSFGLRTCF